MKVIIEWISVNDRLPEHDELVIIYSKYGREFVVYNKANNCWDDIDGDDYYRDIEWATYWIPLPEPPKV